MPVECLTPSKVRFPGVHRFVKHPLPYKNLERFSNNSQAQCALAISALAHPLVLRFRYHFDGKRQTNRLDKPEWYFAHVLNALHDHEPFIREEVQSLLNHGGFDHIDAMTDFITSLIKPLNRKIRASMPQLLEMPSILAHTLYQALQFDQSLRDVYSYRPRMERGKTDEWKGTADIILGNKAWFNGWKESERKCRPFACSCHLPNVLMFVTAYFHCSYRRQILRNHISCGGMAYQ